MNHDESYHDIEETPSVSAPQPIVSFGVPVRNGEKYLPKLFDSLLAQEFAEFEVIIGDNLSDDRTEAICRDYARRDPRIKYFRHPENLGQSGNFNRVLELAQGQYFRWIGDDDWIEPDYTRKCVEFLQRRPDLIGVTTEQRHHFDDGTFHYKEYRGDRLDSPLPHIRFRRMIWFMTADYGFIDPIYTMYRRDAILKTHGMLLIQAQDQVLATELSLVGPFGHIPECLAHRRRHSYHVVSQDSLVKHYEPKNAKKIQGRHLRPTLTMWEFVQRSPMSGWQKLLCALSLVRYLATVIWWQERNRLHAAFGLRSRLRRLLTRRQRSRLV
jgi:glycosyltransferase involved in cell wall biosynthesis